MRACFLLAKIKEKKKEKKGGCCKLTPSSMFNRSKRVQLRQQGQKPFSDGTDRPYKHAPRPYWVLALIGLFFLGILAVVGGVLAIVFLREGRDLNGAPKACFVVRAPLGPDADLIEVDASCSRDREGDQITYAWTWNDGSAIEKTLFPITNHTFIFGLPVEIELCVSDPRDQEDCTSRVYTRDSFFEDVDFDTDPRYCGSRTNECTPSELCCGGQCINPQSDGLHCGSCGEVCSPLPLVCVAAQCLNLATDDDNCGALGAACPAGQKCCSGQCYDLQNDFDNCGLCGSQCPPNWGCINGRCIDLSQDTQNCGAIGNVCPQGWDCCSGVCKDILNDPLNCGGCGLSDGDGNLCTENDQCVAGVPVPGTAVECAAPTECTFSYCAPDRGCVNGDVADGGDCGDDFNFECRGGQCLPKLICGNGYLQPENGESCDDNNTLSGDGCSPNCRNELSCSDSDSEQIQLYSPPFSGGTLFSFPVALVLNWRNVLALPEVTACGGGGGGGGAGLQSGGDTTPYGAGGGAGEVRRIFTLPKPTSDVELSIADRVFGGLTVAEASTTPGGTIHGETGEVPFLRVNGINRLAGIQPGQGGLGSSLGAPTAGGNSTWPEFYRYPFSVLPYNTGGRAGSTTGVPYQGGDGLFCSGGGGGGFNPVNGEYGEGGRGGFVALYLNVTYCNAWITD